MRSCFFFPLLTGYEPFHTRSPFDELCLLAMLRLSKVYMAFK